MKPITYWQRDLPDLRLQAFVKLPGQVSVMVAGCYIEVTQLLDWIDANLRELPAPASGPHVRRAAESLPGQLTIEEVLNGQV